MRNKIFLCFWCTLFFVGNSVYCQYADKGTGMARNDIWWFDWNNFPLVNGSSKIFQLPGGLEVNIEIDDLLDADYYASKMNTWSGSILHLLYDFSDPAIKPALFSEMSTRNPSFTLRFNVTRDGQKIPYTIVAADAEASDNHEFTTFNTSGSTWETIQFFRNSNQTNNPVKGCGTTTVTLSETYGGAAQTGQNPVLATSVDGTQPLIIKTSMQRVGVYGGMAVAFGILAPLDYGDLPLSYGFAYHQLNHEIINACNTTTPLPGIKISRSLVLGEEPGDSDEQGFSDDNLLGFDEDAISSFPTYQNNGTYQLNFPLINQTGAIAYLNAWFDFNRNGIFEVTEKISKSIPPNATNTIIEWSGLPTHLPTGTMNGYAFRIRLSNNQSSIATPTGYSPSGEVEDYFISSEKLCTLRVNAGPDLELCPGDVVQLAASGATEYSWETDAALSDLTIPNPIVTPSTASRFVVVGKDPQACVDRDTILVDLKPLPNLTSYKQEICLGEQTQLNVTTENGLQFTWESHPDITDYSSQSPTVKPAGNTVYKVSVSANNGCRNSAEVTIETKPLPAIDLISDTIICSGTSLTISNIGEAATAYRWFNSAGQLSTGSPSLSYIPSSPQKIYLEGTSFNGCTSIDSAMISFYAPIKITAPADTVTCSGTPVSLISNGAVSYSWYNQNLDLIGNSNTLEVSPSTASTYYLSVLDANSCSFRDTINIAIRTPSKMSAKSSAPIVCKDGTVLLEADGGLNYSWSINNNPPFAFSSAVEVAPIQSTIYKVEIVDSICNSSQVIELPIELKMPPNLSIVQSNNITCKTPEAVLRVTGGESFVWFLNNENLSSQTNSIKIKPIETSTYRVIAFDDNGCSSIDSIRVVVDFSDKYGNPAIPSAFSPNKDGKNDCFAIKNWPRSTTFSFEIFDRYGQLIFSTANTDACWDGTLRGKQQPEGTYIYQIRSEGTCGSINKKGLLILLR